MLWRNEDPEWGEKQRGGWPYHALLVILMDEVLPSIISWVIPPKKKQKKFLNPKKQKKEKNFKTRKREKKKNEGSTRAFTVVANNWGIWMDFSELVYDSF